jgi:hypothetical protein
VRVNGSYSILAAHSGKALDVWEWGTTDGTNIVQYNYWGGGSQIFDITSVDGIWHRITPAIALDQAVDVAGCVTDVGANIQTWSYGGRDCQQFRFETAGQDRYRIIARNSGLCLDVLDASQADGANVIQSTCIGGAENQIFTMKPAQEEGLYVAPNGNDSNPGTIGAPFRSITRAQEVASSGDTVYLRGGTYSGFTIAGSDANYNFVHNITKSGITYSAYPGETPVFNFSGTTTAKRVAAFHIASGVSVTFIGFQVTGVPVGSQKQSECFRIEGNATFDRMTCRDNQANGFYFTTNASGSCTNCDSYNNIGVGTAVSNTDGFGAHCKGSVTFRYCRAWNCSDDGFDCIATYSPVTFDHCWVYNINTSGGDGNGFKVGGWGSATVPSTVPSHIVKYCLAANIKNSGFYANHHPGKSADWTHNTAYNCGSDYNMLERVSPTDATDIPGYREVLHYNVAYAGTIISNSNLPAANITNNSWTRSGVSVSSSDFQSTDASQITRARNADGSLPSITFMKLASGSDLAGMGYDQ